MKPRLILLLAVFMECVLLFMVLSPGRGSVAESATESTRWRDDPTPEAERAMRREMLIEKWRPRVIWTLIGVNGVFVVGYGVGVCRRGARTLEGTG